VKLNKSLNEEFKKHHIPTHQRAHWRSKAQKEIIPYIENRLNSILEFGLKDLLEKMPDIVKRGHLKVFSKTVIPQDRANEYNKLTWRLNYSVKDYILGDFGVLIEIESVKKYITFWINDFEIKRIYLPISKNHLIVGSKSKDEEIMDSSELNVLMAEHARDYFISSKKNPELTGLIKLIGNKSQILSDEEIFNLCDQLFHI